MKHLIAIFSVILTLGMVMPGAVWALSCPATCAGRDCDADHDLIIGAIVDSNAPLFQCGDGCGKGTFVAFVGNYYIDKDDGRKNTGGLDKDYLRVCDDPGYNNKWCAPSKTSDYKDHGIDRCSDALSKYVANAEYKSKNRMGEFVHTAVCDDDMTGCGVKVPESGCYGWFCKSGFHWDNASSACVDDKAQNSEQIDPWVECTASGGTPNGSVCDCTAVEPEKTVSPDGKKCVTNDKYPKCTDSGGTWSGGICQCDSGKGLAGPNSADECYCKDTGKIYNGTQCVDSPETWCTGTGGQWNDASETCNCDIPSKNIKEVLDLSPTRCECVDSDYEFESDKSKGCKLTNAAQRRNQAFTELKKNCEEYWVGSTWFPSDVTSPDVRDRDKWKCECDASHGFVSTFDGMSCGCDDAKGWVLDSVRPPYKCRMTSYEQDKLNCDAAIAAGADVTWKDNGVVNGRNTGYCKCNNSNKMYNYHTKQCLDGTTAATVCSMIDGAALSRDGRCLCLTTERPPVNYKCPTTGGRTSHSGNGDANVGVFQAQANQKKQQITDISKKLKEISDTFGRSHWKNADGKFNTARLASDSIAGVVLGTVGGVVTSNIIKKNQVRGGFESINCNVGGQKVADYGDLFQVGIR